MDYFVGTVLVFFWRISMIHLERPLDLDSQNFFEFCDSSWISILTHWIIMTTIGALVWSTHHYNFFKLIFSYSDKCEWIAQINFICFFYNKSLIYSFIVDKKAYKASGNSNEVIRYYFKLKSSKPSNRVQRRKPFWVCRKFSFDKAHWT